MRTTTLLVLALVASAPQAAFALSPSDTVAEWEAASDADRAKVVEDWQRRLNEPGGVSRDDLVDCIDSAAGVGGHESFSIGDIAAACTEQLRSRNGVEQQTRL